MVIAQSGGPSMVINQSLVGAVLEARGSAKIGKILGAKHGILGILGNDYIDLRKPSVKKLEAIAETPSSALGSCRKKPNADDCKAIFEEFRKLDVGYFFYIGGNDSADAARIVAEEAEKADYPLVVYHIPKTIDNDLQFVGRSFGFETAVGVAANVIGLAHVEAKGTPNGVGLVKLMGRDSGFIAAYAAMANPIVNFCLVPEMNFALEGPNGLLAALEKRFAVGKGHAVIVVAEGAGQDLIAGASEKDASGNVLKKDIGVFLKDRITAHFKEKDIPTSVKYFDPSYSIRSVPAHGTDAIRCYLLARNAVHAAMAGRTSCVIGNVGESYTIVPIKLATIERQTLSLTGDLWRSVIGSTGQELYFNDSALDRNMAP